MTKDSSAEMATLASRILAGGDPFDNDQCTAAIARAFIRQGANASSAERAVKEIEAVLRPYLDNMTSLAGSVLAQAGDR